MFLNYINIHSLGQVSRGPSAWGWLQKVDGPEGKEETLFLGEEKVPGHGNALLEMSLQLTVLEIYK